MKSIKIFLLIIVSSLLSIGYKSTYSTTTDIDTIHRQLKWEIKPNEQGNYQQALERADSSKGNKGSEAVLSAMLLLESLSKYK